MTKIKAFPIFPDYSYLLKYKVKDNPKLMRTIAALHDDLFVEQVEYGIAYLMFVGRNKSQHTYNRFRIEIERFLLWSMLVKKESIFFLTKEQFLEYADFCFNPPVAWIGKLNQARFNSHSPYKLNKAWFPFKVKIPKGMTAQDVNIENYSLSVDSLKSMFTAVTSFYKYLNHNGKCELNPASSAKHDCRHLVTDSTIKPVSRLSHEHWKHVVETAIKMADENPVFETNLFLVITLKTLFLRVSELSGEYPVKPKMNSFRLDENGDWWLKVYGKGKKIREIPLPDDYLHYLKRYRLYRGLSSYPMKTDDVPLVSKVRGKGYMTTRHLRRLVQMVFDRSAQEMMTNFGEKKALKLREVTTHWLRHTGASMEIERGRDLKDVSEDLGHASMSTTDTIYIQVDSKRRAASGKNRKVI
jgi:site-specific recombinase XerD